MRRKLSARSLFTLIPKIDMLQIHDIIPGERDGVQFPCIWYLEQSPSTAKKFILLYVYIYTHMYMYKKKTKRSRNKLPGFRHPLARLEFPIVLLVFLYFYNRGKGTFFTAPERFHAPVLA